MEANDKYQQQIVLTYQKLLSDDSHSDVVIKVGSESVHGHAAVICMRCPEIVGLPNNEEKKKKAKKMEVKIKDSSINAASMNIVLEFLYTGTVDFTKLSDNEILLLVKAARFFKLDRLSYLCEQRLTQQMTIESVFHLLKAATDHKEERIKGFCLQFALANYNAFIANKNGVYILGIELFQEVVAAFPTNPAPPPSIYPEGGPPDTLLADFRRLYETMPYSDFIVSAKGTPVKCHKALLTVFSEKLASSLMREVDPILSISADAFNSALRFCYYGHPDVEAKPACQLMSFSRNNKLDTLLRICEEKIRHSIDCSTVIDVLEVSYLPSDNKSFIEELQNKCFPFILQNLDKVDLTMSKAFNPLMTVDLLLRLQSASKSNEYGLGCISNGGSGGTFTPTSTRSVVSEQQTTPKSQPPPPVSKVLNTSSSSSDKPLPPPRKSVSSKTSDNLPPPVIGGTKNNFPAPPPSVSTPPKTLTTEPEQPVTPKRGLLTRRKSQKDISSDTLKSNPKKLSKKEEEKKKKAELKRLEKEKKERKKLEKKSKG